MEMLALDACITQGKPAAEHRNGQERRLQMTPEGR
jgi:hypothetical protein